MRSFISALIVVSLAAFSSAAPIASPDGNSGGYGFQQGSNQPVGYSVEIKNTGPQIQARGSVPDVLSGLVKRVQPLTEQLSSFTSSNFTITQTASTLDSIESLISTTAQNIPSLSTVSDELSIPEAASILGQVVSLTSNSCEYVYDLANAAGGNTVLDIKADVSALGDTISDLLSAAVSGIPGLDSALSAVLAPTSVVLAELDWSKIAAFINLTV